MHCSYCESEMELTKVKVNRPVPNGAKNLNLQDDVTCWQCPQCKQTSNQDLVECQKCGVVGLKSYPFSISPTNSSKVQQCLLSWESKYEGETTSYYTCLNCLKCSVCNQPFDGPNLNRKKTTDYDKDVADLCGNDDHSNYYDYSHKKCPEGHTKSESKSGSTYSTQTTTPEKSRKPLVILFIIVAFVVWAIFINSKGSNTTLKPTSAFVGKECNLRSTPSKGKNIIKTIPKGGSVTILENSGEWAKVRYINSEGYIKSNLLSH